MNFIESLENMDKIFLTDADGVLLDWSQGIIKYIQNNYPHINLDFSDYGFGIDRKSLDKIVDEFNVSSDFANLKALNDAVEYVHTIADLGYKFVVITTCLATEQSVGTEYMRVKNLETVFGSGIFSDVYCLPIGTSKMLTLQKYKPTFWVDDKLKHSIDGAKAGHESFQMVHAYNEKDIRPDNIIAVRSWKEIHEYIISIP